MRMNFNIHKLFERKCDSHRARIISLKQKRINDSMDRILTLPNFDMLNTPDRYIGHVHGSISHAVGIGRDMQYIHTVPLHIDTSKQRRGTMYRLLDEYPTLAGYQYMIKQWTLTRDN